MYINPRLGVVRHKKRRTRRLRFQDRHNIGDQRENKTWWNAATRDDEAAQQRSLRQIYASLQKKALPIDATSPDQCLSWGRGENHEHRFLCVYNQLHRIRLECTVKTLCTYITADQCQFDFYSFFCSRKRVLSGITIIINKKPPRQAKTIY